MQHQHLIMMQCKMDMSQNTTGDYTAMLGPDVGKML